MCTCVCVCVCVRVCVLVDIGSGLLILSLQSETAGTVTLDTQKSQGDASDSEVNLTTSLVLCLVPNSTALSIL